MKKLLSILALVTMIFGATAISSCSSSKYSTKDLQGKWVNSVKEIGEEDGETFETVTESAWDFQGDRFTRSHTVYVDGVEAIKTEVSGTFTYNEPELGFEDKDVIGVIECDYDLATLKFTYNDEMPQDFRPEFEEEWRTSLKEENLKTQKTKLESMKNTEKDLYSGWFVKSLENNRLVLESDQGETLFIKQ